jgi:hypothetical protein
MVYRKTVSWTGVVCVVVSVHLPVESLAVMALRMDALCEYTVKGEVDSAVEH